MFDKIKIFFCFHHKTEDIFTIIVDEEHYTTYQVDVKCVKCGKIIKTFNWDKWKLINYD